MARILPDGWRELAVTGAAQREIETLALLADRLADDYTVYHAVHWTNLERGFAAFGEIDFIVLGPAGQLLLIEQKSGFLDEGPDGLQKRYAGKSKRVAVQMARSAGALRSKLGRRPGCQGAQVDSLLYCPDYHVRHPETAGIVAERIVDASRRDRLPEVIGRLLPATAPADPALNVREVHRFLRDVIQLDSDVSALLGRARDMVTRISGGLAHWARQLEMTPFRLRVTGTAGSGKTQLALAEYRAAIDAGRRPLYVCFNRPLADHFAAIAPGGTPGQGLACTFHMLCERIVRAGGETPDFSAADSFARLEARAAQLDTGAGFRFDTVIVDEGQDFSEDWRDLVLGLAAPAARLLWLEDPLQNLYGRPPLPLPGWVGLRASGNYRSPRGVVRMLHGLLGEDGAQAIEALSPFESGEVEVLSYADAAGMLQQVKEAIRQCYSAGFRKQDVAIVSYHGRDNSQLMHHDRIGSNTLRTFTGRYDLLGQPVFSEGDLLLESVYRFKGQAAPAVIFAEIDFETLDDRALRKLFVGTTRAMMKLVLVMSEAAAGRLLARIDAAT